MTGDALLDLFQLDPPQRDIYRIGQYSPVSIRDQVVRAVYLTERLWKTARLTKQSSLLVIGAGAAGVTVALEAVALGVKQVVVADMSDRVLSLQAQCKTRWVDPTQYDWPAHHWSHTEWPIREAPTSALAPFLQPLRTAQAMPPPVTLRADYATAWSSRFDRPFFRQQTLGTIDFKPYTKVTSWAPKPGSSTLYIVNLEDVTPGVPPGQAASPPTVEADAIVFAGGFGQERTSVPIPGTSHHYVGTAFWSTDGYELADFGLGRAPTNGVLVSGTGDGSLQDFARLVTGIRSVRDIWDVIAAALSPHWLHEFDTLWHWEDHVRRSSEFAPEYFDTCELLERLHYRYGELLMRIWTSPDMPKVMAALGALVGSRPVNKVFLAQKGNHFDACYPLNRALALSLLFSLSYSGHGPLLQNTAVKSATPSGPLATSNVPWGTSIDVELANGVDCSTSHAAIQAWMNTTATTYDGIVVRHGIDPSTLSVKASKLKPQHVPPHLP